MRNARPKEIALFSKYLLIMDNTGDIVLAIEIISQKGAHNVS
jgi:hypothetical protein